MRRFLAIVGLSCLAACALGCQPFAGAGQRPEGTRAVSLRLPSELIVALGNEVAALQLACVVIDRTEAQFYNSPAVDPSTGVELLAYAPKDLTFVPVIQTRAANKAGRLIARILAPNGAPCDPGPCLTELMPHEGTDIDFGRPTYSGSIADPMSSLLLVDAASSPVTTAHDPQVSDSDGDGIPDAQQRLDSLEDSNSNGIPDMFE